MGGEYEREATESGKVVIGQDDNNTQTHMGLEAIRAMREL